GPTKESISRRLPSSEPFLYRSRDLERQHIVPRLGHYLYINRQAFVRGAAHRRRWRSGHAPGHRIAEPAKILFEDRFSMLQRHLRINRAKDGIVFTEKPSQIPPVLIPLPPTFRKLRAAGAMRPHLLDKMGEKRMHFSTPDSLHSIRAE